MPDLVADYLGRRPLDADLDRAAFVAAGRGYVERVERTLADASVAGGAGGGGAGGDAR
jgi:hypothetical protein